MVLPRRKLQPSLHRRIGESSRCLENKVKEQNSHVTRVIYKQIIFNNHPSSNISYFKITDLYNKQVTREGREVIHIRIKNPALNCNTGKMYILEIFNHLLGADRSSNEFNQLAE